MMMAQAGRALVSARLQARGPVRAGLPLLQGWQRYVVESIGLVLLLVWIDHAFFNATRFADITPRPFWIPILLMSVQYGLAGGVFATIAATIALYGAALPSQLATQDYYAYSRLLVAEPTSWLACALVLGGLRSLHLAHAAELRQQVEEARAVAIDVGDGLQQALEEIGRLEARIAGDARSVGAIGRALSGFDARDDAHLAATYAELGRLVIGATSLAIYRRDARGAFVPVAAAHEGGGRDLAPSACLPDGLLRALNQPGPRVWRAGAADGTPLPPDITVAATIAAGAEVPRGLVLVGRILPGAEPDLAARRTEDVARGLLGLLP
jgi:hypothetical protein